MSELISRKAVIDAISTWDKFGVDERVRIVRWREGLEPYVKLMDVITAIVNTPSEQPEITRCRDCKHWIPYDWMFSEIWRSKNMADYPEDEIGCNWCDMAMKANDFCSRGEKREVTT